MYPKIQTDLKSDKNCGHWGHCTVFFGASGIPYQHNEELIRFKSLQNGQIKSLQMGTY